MDELIYFDNLPVITGPKIKNINYFCTTRSGGYSSMPFSSLNLGFNTADSLSNTQNNRDRLTKALPGPVLWLDQVHGNEVIPINNSAMEHTYSNRPKADAAVTNVAGQVLSIVTADCLPVVIAHEDGLCLGVAHAGWRGLLSQVLENTVQTLVKEYGVNTDKLVAWIGPCIHQSTFQIDTDVMQQFVSFENSYAQFFKADAHTPHKWLANLPAIADYKLTLCGLKKVYISSYCTYENNQLFYSYRRDGNTGRQAALAWINV